MNRLRNLDIKYLKGIGHKRAELLGKQLGIKSYRDLLYHFPTRYLDRSSIYRVKDLSGEMPMIQLKGRFIAMTVQGEGAKTILWECSPTNRHNGGGVVQAHKADSRKLPHRQ